MSDTSCKMSSLLQIPSSHEETWQHFTPRPKECTKTCMSAMLTTARTNKLSDSYQILSFQDGFLKQNKKRKQSKSLPKNGPFCCCCFVCIAFKHFAIELNSILQGKKKKKKTG